MLAKGKAIITHIDQLIAELEASQPSKYAQVIKRVKIESLSEELVWCAESYTRNCIKRTREYELIGICWEPGQSTPVHDHGGQKCWVYQVQGDLTETHYSNYENKLTVLAEIELEQGNLSFMQGVEQYHSLSNRGNERAISLHIYTKPIDKCDVYNEADESFESKVLEYDNTI